VTYIYIYLDPRRPGLFAYNFGQYLFKFKYKPFYVGLGKKNRYKAWDAKNRTCKGRIRKIWEDTRRRPYVSRFNCASRERAKLLEKILIRAIGRIDLGKGPLMNFTNGGDGVAGRACSEETREKIRMSKLGKKRSLAVRKKLSIIAKSRTYSSKTRAKMSNSNSRIWKLISPRGKIFFVKGLWKKCKERGWSTYFVHSFNRGIKFDRGFWAGWIISVVEGGTNA
jgi:hypothetical protein